MSGKSIWSRGDIKQNKDVAANHADKASLHLENVSK